MAARPNTHSYTSVDDDEKEWPSTTDGNESLLNSPKHFNGSPKWMPVVRTNTAGFAVLVTSVALLVLASVECTLLYERQGSNAPHWRPVFCKFRLCAPDHVIDFASSRLQHDGHQASY